MIYAHLMYAIDLHLCIVHTARCENIVDKNSRLHYARQHIAVHGITLCLKDFFNFTF